jgi:parvulin-like peptidyl-prolyl isomerase
MMAVVCLSSSLEAQFARPNEVLATAGDRVITSQEFLWRFELTPGPNRGSAERLQEEKRVFLYSLVAEKLLAGEAMRRGLDSDSISMAGLLSLRKLLARDELYREEITRKVSVTKPEVQRTTRDAVRLLLLEYLFFEDESAARVVRSGIRSGQALVTVRIDSSISHLRDTVTLAWGEGDAAIEQAAFALKVGSVSQVIEAGSGYYIVRLLRESRNEDFARMQSGALAERIEQVIRMRRERVRLDEFMANALRGKAGYSRASTLRAIVVSLDALRRATADSTITLDWQDHIPLIAALGGIASDTGAVAGSRWWSGAELVQELCASGFSFPRDLGIRELANKTNLQVRIWVQQELLAQEGLARGLDNSEAVRPLLQSWKDNLLAGRVKRELEVPLDVSDAEALLELSSGDPSSAFPLLQIRELWTASTERMREVLDSLEAGMPFPVAVERFSEDPLTKINGGLAKPFRMDERLVLGEIAWKMEPGEWRGPITLDGKKLAIQLVKREPPPVLRTAEGSARLEKVRERLLALKRKGRMSQAIGRLAKSNGFTVNEENLRALEVSRIPMMTFKVLGFGGRMFAAPFVDRQTEWLDVALPGEEVLP